MNSSIKYKQVNALNSLNHFINNYPSAENLNNTLGNLSSKAIGNFLNNLSKEDFINIKNDKKLKIEIPLLSKIFNCKLIDNKEEYLTKKIVYNIGTDLDSLINYNLSYFLRNEAKHVYFCSKNKSFLKKLFDCSNESLLNDFNNGLNIEYEKYSFNKGAFSDDFLKSFLDYKQNYHIYINHPRIGKDKLTEIVDGIIQKELLNEKTSLLIDFENFSIEFETLKTNKRG